MRAILKFEGNGYREHPLSDKIKLGEEIEIACESNRVIANLFEEQVELKDFQLHRINDVESIMLFVKDTKYFAKNDDGFTIDPNFGDFVIGDLHIWVEKYKILNPTKEAIYINGIKSNEETIQIEEGDILLIRDIQFILHDEYVKVIGNHEAYKSNVSEIELEDSTSKDFPNYRRSPRVIKRYKEEKVSMLLPPQAEKISKGELVKVIVPPLVSAAATIGISFIMPRGPYVLIGILTTGVSLVFSITSYFSEKKEQKEKNRKRKEVYNAYLLRTRNRLEELKMKEIDAATYHYPQIQELYNQVVNYSSRIYEKDTSDDDFLHLCIGYRKEPSSFEIALDSKELDLEKDELLEEARSIQEQYQFMENKPVAIDLKQAHVGLVGDKEDIHLQMEQLLAQLTFFHSYHDIEIVMLYNEAYKEAFDYVKWYPHLKVSAINVTGNIYLEKVRDQVLGSLSQILKQRQDKVSERKRESSFSPHYIIFIDDYHLLMNHSIMEYLQEETTDLGFTLVFSAKQKADLPENIGTVILVEDKQTSTLLLNNKVMVNKRVASPQIKGIDLETMARDLSVLVHHKGMKSQIPESITFFELYGVEQPNQLQVKERWGANNSHKSLSVPLGVRAKDDIVELNLHEKSHGPHGLVAGTTGSGKSEIIQSYILSLAVNFHPHEVGFLLIDYKGGGMASLFKNLPHLLGTITNLDGSESMRALASIKSELQRRQRVFNDHNVNNIIQYNKLFKAGKAEEPLPSLFIISDEFAELKKEQPEFMSELVSAARIGRSLGVKLILATQKPSGVVDDQIWSNSKFKLALKVQDENDSKEVIKTADAAYITQPGRAYLQVGNNEIYELFQSAWSGANYSENKEENDDNLVYRMNDIGQGELINKDLSGEEDSKGVSLSQLDVTVDYIQELYDELDVVEVAKPWLPSLEDKIISPYMELKEQDLSEIQELDLNCPLGIVDIPEQQLQSDYVIDFVEEGNLAIFSSSGFGKSFTMATIMMTLAVKNNPQLLQYYIVDLGNSALISYMNLPHTADYMTFDSDEKISKFMKLMNNMVKERKKLFAQEMVQNYDTYNQMHQEEPLKAIMIFIDNYDVVKEMQVDFEDFIMKLSRDGAGLGIFIVVSATRVNAIRFATLNNFKNKIAQYMYDPTEISSIVGRGKYTLPELKGRALIKQATVNVLQIFTPIPFETTVDFTKEIKVFIQNIKDSYQGEVIKGIPTLPDAFTSMQLSDYEYEDGVNVAAGLCVNDVVVVDADIINSPYLIIGPQLSGKTNVLELLLNQVKNSGKTYIFDSSKLELFKYSKDDEVVKYVSTEEEVRDFIEDLFAEVEDRKEKLQAAMEEEIVSPPQFYSSLPKFSIFIDDADDFIARVDKKYDKFYDLLKTACDVGIQIVATAQANKLKGYDDFTKLFKASINGLVLGNQGTTTVFPVSSTREYPVFGQALRFNNGVYRRIQIPKFNGIEEVK